MIKRSRTGNGLREFASRVTFLDTDTYSKNYFRVMDFPDRFYVGKNLFRISGNDDLLVKGSHIFIDIVDANGNVLYHEILNVKNSDRSRTVVVHVYPDTPVGGATVYIAGRISKDPRNGAVIPFSSDPTSPSYKDIPNIMWIGRVTVVTSKPNTSEIFFIKEPVVYYKERQVSFYVLSGSINRIATETGSASQTLSIQSISRPIQYNDESVLYDEVSETSKVFRGIPEIQNNSAVSRGATPLPEHSKLTIITSNTPLFTKTMEGGRLTVQNISVQSDIPSDAPPSAFSIPAYTASIVRVLNNTSIEVDRPFNVTVDYVSNNGQKRQTVIDKFINQNDFAIEYVDTTIPVEKTWASESFVSMEFRDIEPSAGTVDKVRISYKPVGSFGDFIDVGEYSIGEQNFLVDSGTFESTRELGIVEKPIGYVKNQSDVTTYWQVFSKGVGGTSLQKTDDYVMDGFRIHHSGSNNQDRYVYVKQKTDFITASPGTEYVLTFKSHLQGDPSGSSAWSSPFIDVYISGSGIVGDIVSRKGVDSPIKHGSELGTYVGSVVSADGRLQDNKFYFIAQDQQIISPVFVVRSGLWDIGQIEIRPRKEIGFSPNHVKLNIPLSRFEESSELIIDIDYLNRDGVAANLDTKLYGVYFTGGKSSLSQSIVVVNDSLLQTSSSFSSRVTGTISGSEILYHDSKSGSLAGTLSRLEIGVKDGFAKTGSTGGEILLVASTASLAGGAYVIRNDHNKVKPSVSEYVHSEFLGIWVSTGSESYTVKYPIMFRTDNHRRYRFNERVHMIYEIDTMIVGYSGSVGTYYDSYVWGGTLRGRVISDGGGSPSLAASFVSSASMLSYKGYERFGTPTPSYSTKFSYEEKALYINATHSFSTLSGSLNIDYTFNQFGAGGDPKYYDLYLVSNIKVVRMEFFLD